MPAPRKHDPETRDRVVRLYREWRKCDAAESMSASRKHVGGLLGINPESLRDWIDRDDINAGQRPGATDEQNVELKAVREENAELRRANEDLKVASAYFA